MSETHDPLCATNRLKKVVSFCDCEWVSFIRREVHKEIATDLREQAETANFSARGRHPKIKAETHAAALRWAATRVESGNGSS